MTIDFLTLPPCTQVEEEETPTEKGFESSLGLGRGRTTRGRTQRRGLSKYRQTQRKPRSTIRSSFRHGRGDGSGQQDEIQLQEVATDKK